MFTLQPSSELSAPPPFPSSRWDKHFIGPVSALSGLRTLLGYGLMGSVLEFGTAPFFGQIPLAFGFTLELPWTVPELPYQVGTPGTSKSMQWPAHLAGQRVFPDFPLRTHTTGLIDFGVRQGIWGSEAALELIHPGRVASIRLEDLRMADDFLVSGSWAADDVPSLASGQYDSGAFGGANKGGVADSSEFVDPGCVSSAMGFSSPKGGSSGGIVNDYTTSRRIRRL